MHGFSYFTKHEIDAVFKEATEEWLGRDYNILKRNCNHFTDWLARRLTGRGLPAWVNRAAGIGVKLPCLVPPEWLAPPEAEEGELVGDGDESDSTETDRMLEHGGRVSLEDGRGNRVNLVGFHNGHDERGQRGDALRDSDGRVIPEAERAPLPRIG